MAFWCCDDLSRAGAVTNEVRDFRAPVALQYHLVACDWNRIDQLAGARWKTCLTPQSNRGLRKNPSRALRPSDFTWRKQLLGPAGSFLRPTPPVQPTDQPPGQTRNAQQRRRTAFPARDVRLPERAPGEAEARFPSTPKGSIVERFSTASSRRAGKPCTARYARALRLELQAWPTDAQEGRIQMNHMRLAEAVCLVAAPIVAEKPSIRTATASLLLVLWGRSRIRSPQAGKRPPRWARR